MLGVEDCSEKWKNEARKVWRETKYTERIDRNIENLMMTSPSCSHDFILTSVEKVARIEAIL